TGVSANRRRFAGVGFGTRLWGAGAPAREPPPGMADREKLGEESGARFDPAPAVRRPSRPANKFVESHSRKEPPPTRRPAPRPLSRMFMNSSSPCRDGALPRPSRARLARFPPCTSVSPVVKIFLAQAKRHCRDRPRLSNPGTARRPLSPVYLCVPCGKDFSGQSKTAQPFRRAVCSLLSHSHYCNLKLTPAAPAAPRPQSPPSPPPPSPAPSSAPASQSRTASSLLPATPSPDPPPPSAKPAIVPAAFPPQPASTDTPAPAPGPHLPPPKPHGTSSPRSPPDTQNQSGTDLPAPCTSPHPNLFASAPTLRPRRTLLSSCSQSPPAPFAAARAHLAPSEPGT